MTLTQHELGIIFHAFTLDRRGEARKFAFPELGKVSELSKKIASLPEDGKLTQPTYEVDFDTDQKALILTIVRDMDWSFVDSQTVLGLEEKLK